MCCFSINKIGSSTLASTFSNGAKDPNTGVATTDLYGKCTTTHSGTSAAAPEAAGVFALALEAKYVKQTRKKLNFPKKKKMTSK